MDIYIFFIFFALFQKIKLPFTCWLPPAKSHQRERDWSRRVCEVETRTTVSPRMNFQRRSASLPPVHRLGCSRQQANLCLSLFFSSSYLSKGLSCIHFKQTNRTSPEWGHVQVSRTCLLGTAGRLVFFFEQMCCRHINSRLTQQTRRWAASIHNQNGWKFCSGYANMGSIKYRFLSMAFDVKYS